MHLLCRHRAYAPETLDGKTGYKIQRLVRVDGTQSIRLAIVRSNLCQELIIRYTGGCYKIKFFPYLLFDFLSNIHRQWNAGFILRHIKESLIQRKRLNNIRIFMKNFMYLTGNILIHLHSSGHKDKLRTKPLCFRRRHGRTYSIATRLITGSRHHSPFFRIPHCNRFSAQLRIVTLLYGCVKRIHIYMYDFSFSAFATHHA